MTRLGAAEVRVTKGTSGSSANKAAPSTLPIIKQSMKTISDWSCKLVSEGKWTENTQYSKGRVHSHPGLWREVGSIPGSPSGVGDSLLYCPDTKGKPPYLPWLPPR